MLWTDGAGAPAAGRPHLSQAVLQSQAVCLTLQRLSALLHISGRRVRREDYVFCFY